MTSACSSKHQSTPRFVTCDLFAPCSVPNPLWLRSTEPVSEEVGHGSLTELEHQTLVDAAMFSS